MGAAPLLILLAAVGGSFVTPPVDATSADSQRVTSFKPDPQGGGITLPQSMNTPVGTSPVVSTDPTNQRSNQWSNIEGRAATSGSGGASLAPPPLASSTREEPPTGASPGDTRPGGVDPVNPSAASAPAASARAQAANTPPASLSVGNPSGGSHAAAPRAATTPDDPNWSGYGTTANFGSLPPGVGMLRHAAETASSQADSAQTGTPRAAAGGEGQTAAGRAGGAPYGRDEYGNLLDQVGRAVDAQGRPIDPKTGYLLDGNQNFVDEHGRRLDQIGRPLPGETAAPAFAGGQPSAAQLPGGTAYPGSGIQERFSAANPPPAAAALPAANAPPAANRYASPGAYPATAPYPPANQAANPQVATNPYPTNPYPTNPYAAQPAPAASYPAAGQYGDQYAGQLGGQYGGGTAPYPAQQYSGQQYSGQQHLGANSYPPRTAASEYLANNSNRPTASEDRDYQGGDQQREWDRRREEERRREDDRRREEERQRTETKRANDDLLAKMALEQANAELKRQIEQNQSPARGRRVAIQPFFYFLFLISVIGNAYLIFETSNLRRKFRNMIASVRSTKVSAQPVS